MDGADPISTPLHFRDDKANPIGFHSKMNAGPFPYPYPFALRAPIRPAVSGR
jgi:hypothetical protein